MIVKVSEIIAFARYLPITPALPVISETCLLPLDYSTNCAAPKSLNPVSVDNQSPERSPAVSADEAGRVELVPHGRDHATL